MNEGLIPLMTVALLLSLTGGTLVARRPEQVNQGLITMLLFQLLGGLTLHFTASPALYALLAIHLTVIACLAICPPVTTPQREPSEAA